MALQHAAPGECIALERGDDDIAHFTSVALAKTDHMELIRLVVPTEKPLPEHWVEGEMTLLCLEGELVVELRGRSTILRPNEMLYLAGREPHAVRANADAVALMTILLRPGDNAGGPIKESALATG
jgi:quercetin dioxygenase-like cupin family protein